MGAEGLRLATEVAILNANYVSKKLEGSYKTLYKGKNDLVAHEKKSNTTFDTTSQYHCLEIKN